MSNDWFFEKFALIADAPGAVEKMRELVLQLAVTGRLVPQEPTDEPASELTEKALSFVDNGVSSAQRARDIGKWKTVVDSGLSELPLGWTWTCNAVIGNTSPRVSVSDDALVAFVPMNVIPKDYRESLNPEIRLWTEIKRGYTHFADGDIVVAKITPCFQNGKACVMKDLPGGVGAGTTELHVLRPVPNTVIPLYMLLIFKSPEFVNGGVASFTGTAGQQRVSTDYFRYCPIPLPPLAEQKRIVAKVDEMMGLCDALEAQQQERELRKSVLVRSSLSRFAESPTPENLRYLFHKSYDIPPSELRKSILTLAVQGKLVPQDPNDELAITTLEEIEAEKAALIEARKLRPNLVTEIPQTKELQYEVPDSWRWFRLGDVAFFQEGPGIRNWQFRTQGIKLLNVQNIVDGSLVLENTERYIAIEEFESTYRHFAVETGDILFASSGASWGKTAWFKDNGFTVMLNTSMVRLKFYSQKCFDAFLLLFLRTEFFKTQMELQLVGIQPNFGSTHLGRVYIPIPPLAEQRRIVAKVDQLMALVDELERQQDESREKATKLLNAIVQEMTSSGQGIAATLES